MTADVPLRPEGSVLLHVGPPKTGSTAIQRAMHASRAGLAEHGVFYPGPEVRPTEAGWAVMGVGMPVGRPPARMELWDRLVSDVAGTGLPRVCVSNEDFSRADAAATARIVRALGADRVHLVFVARRLDKLLPSSWQQRLKARMTWSYPEFLTQMAAPEDGDWDRWMMWSPHDVAQVIDRWAEHVDRSQITVIVSDEHDHGLIPRTFSQLLGVPEEMLAPPTDVNNRSLTYPQAEAMRRVNQVFEQHGWTALQYWRIVQAGLAETLKLSPLGDEAQPIPGLPTPVLEVVNDRADAQVEAIIAAGVQVVGDPDRLRTRGRLAPDDSPEVVDAVSLDLLGSVVAGVVSGALDLQEHALLAQRREARRHRKRARRSTAPDLDQVPTRELAAHLRGRVVGRLRRTLRRS